MAGEWLTVSEACRVAGVRSRTSIMQQIRAGNIKARKVGPIWLVERSSLEAYARKKDPRRGRRRKLER